MSAAIHHGHATPRTAKPRTLGTSRAASCAGAAVAAIFASTEPWNASAEPIRSPPNHRTGTDVHPSATSQRSRGLARASQTAYRASSTHASGRPRAASIRSASACRGCPAT